MTGKTRFPWCGWSQIKKAGSDPRKVRDAWGRVQGFQYLRCGKKFTEEPPFCGEMKFLAADLYFDQEASFRAVDRALGLAPLTAFHRINEVGSSCKSCGKVAKEVCFQWGGRLFADGKAIFVTGKEHALLYCGLRAQVERREAHLPFPFTFQRHFGMLPTNGMMEGIIRQLNRTIHDTDGYERPDTAWNSLMLLILHYRFHRFSCSRIPGHNGLSPLELAGVQTEGIHWMRFSQRST